MNELDELVQALTFAAETGAQKVGHQAVQAGVAHAANGERELASVETITGSTTDLHGIVTASQDERLGLAGPRVAASTGIADAMAHRAAEAGAEAVKK